MYKNFIITQVARFCRPKFDRILSNTLSLFYTGLLCLILTGATERALHAAEGQPAPGYGIPILQPDDPQSVGPQSDHRVHLTMGGTGWSIAIMRAAARAFMASQPDITISIPDSVGSSGGIRALLAGTFAASFAARPLKPSEAAQGTKARPILKTPFVLAVSSKLGDDLNVSTSDIYDIYGRRLASWPDGTPIRPVVRQEDDTDSRVLVQHFPGIAPTLERARAARGRILVYTDQEAMSYAERVPGALITTTLMAIRAENRSLNPIALNGIIPSPDTLSAGTYPMAITLQLVTADASPPEIDPFLQFLETPEARDLIRRNGALPISHD